MWTRTTIAAALALLLLSTLTGCNTVRGIGKDIHDIAQNVQMALEGNQENYAHIPPPESRTAYYSARP